MSVLRKLGFVESMLDKEFVDVGGEMQTRALLFELKQGEITRHLLEQACTYWVKHLPLLGAEIKREPTQSFFVQMDPELIFNFDKTVQLIETEDAREWERLIQERQIFDKNKGHLWKLKLVKINNHQELDYNYVLILTTQHSTTDGRNGYEISRRLLNIIGSLVLGQTCPEMDENNVVFPKYNTDELVEQTHKLDKDFKPVPVLDKVNRISASFSDPDAENLTRLRHFIVPSEKFKKLLKKMKENSKETKMTSVLSMVCCLAYKNLLKRHNITDVPTDTLPYSLLVNFRDKLGVSSATMGAFVNGFDQMLSREDSARLDLNTIWSVAEKQSIALHTVLQSNYYLDSTLYQKEHWLDPEPEGGPEPNVFDFFFRLSNYGVVPNTDVTNIKIKQHYVMTLKIYGRHLGNISMNLCTIEGNLCWSCIYNQKRQSNKHVTELLDEVNHIIDQLVAN